MSDMFNRVSSESDPPELTFLSKLPIIVAGAEPDVVAKKCPEDIGKLTASGTVGLGAFFYNSTVFTGVASHLAGGFSLGIAAGGVSLAAYILATDSYLFFRCAHLVSGFEQLAQAGVEVSIPRKVQKMIRRSLAIRIAQSGCLGLVVGVMTSLVVYSEDINARITLDNLQSNAGTVRQLSEQTDSGIKRASEAVNLTAGNIALLNKQINGRLARGGSASSNAQVQALESRKAAEETRLVAQKSELSRLEFGRNDRLRTGLASDPTAVRANTGVLAQINALEKIAGDDWKIGFLILLVEFVAIGFDLAPILAKMSWLPTRYSVLMAREYLERMQKTVEEMVPYGADQDPGDDLPDAEPPDDDGPRPIAPDRASEISPANDNITIPDQVKRGRGRPRKSAPLINGSGT